jgi:hypothetical protein
MRYPMLLAAIGSAGFFQYEVAGQIGTTETRLSQIINRGNATPTERQKLSEFFGIAEDLLFGPGLPVRVSAGATAVVDRGPQAA